MRIIAGEWRGRPLLAPPGRETRPTSDRAREGLFSMLASRLGSFEGLEVADLFAGTGALGLEALSRGAAYCTFVETGADALEILRRNIRRLGAADRSDIRAQPAEQAAAPRHPCGLILMDPPYRSGLAQRALLRVADSAWLAPGGWIAVELQGESLDLPAGLGLDTERRFGRAAMNLIRKGGRALS